MVYFKISGGEIEPTIEISRSELIFDLKCKIEDELEVKVHRQNLWYNGIELENEKKIEFYVSGGEESHQIVTLHVNPLPPDVKIHVLVRLNGHGSDGYVRAWETDKVRDLRDKVSRYWGIPHDLITLRRLNVEMRDEHPLHAYYINEASEIYLSVGIEPR